jgi:hypothetical protein
LGFALESRPQVPLAGGFVLRQNLRSGAFLRAQGRILTLTIKANHQRNEHGAVSAATVRACLTLSGLLLLSRP